MCMDTPLLVINFKTYEESRSTKGILLAKMADNVAEEYSVGIIVVPQLIDCLTIADQVNIPVFAQHLDPNPSGSATGHIDPYALIDGGIKGTLLNHSERRLGISILEKSIEIANKINLKSIICAGTIPISKAVCAFNPWAVAMEPPELIGGDVSVTTRPKVVQDSVLAIQQGNNQVIPLIGAGVKTSEHVKKAIELGAQGVLLASGVVKAKDPKLVITQMVEVMNK